MRSIRILLDGMYSRLKPFLKMLGWDAQLVDDLGLRGTEGSAIAEYASKNGLLIVTQDQVTADLVRLKGVPCVLVGLVEIARIVDEVLRNTGVNSN